MKIYQSHLSPEHQFPLAASIGAANLSDSKIAIVGYIEGFIQRYETRKVLGELNQWQLRDIGISLEQARREAAKPFWKA